jgi:hypothetical protein
MKETGKPCITGREVIEYKSFQEQGCAKIKRKDSCCWRKKLKCIFAKKGKSFMLLPLISKGPDFFGGEKGEQERTDSRYYKASVSFSGANSGSNWRKIPHKLF